MCISKHGNVEIKILIKKNNKIDYIEKKYLPMSKYVGNIENYIMWTLCKHTCKNNQELVALAFFILKTR